MSGENSYARQLETILNPLVVLLEQDPPQLPGRHRNGQFGYERKGDGWNFYSHSEVDLIFATFRGGKLQRRYVRHISPADIPKLQEYVRITLEESR